MIEKDCPQCNRSFITTDDSRKFCNKSCAAIFNNRGRKHSEHTKQKIKEWAKKNPVGIMSIPIAERKTRTTAVMENYMSNPRYCICGRAIPYVRRDRKSCSKECSKIIVGGLRKGSGRSKHGWYRGIWCDSLFDLAFVIYHLDHNHQVRRNTVVYRYKDENGIERSYLPDFIVDGCLYEIKGWCDERTMLKAAVVEEMTMIIGKQANSRFIDYAKSKFNLTYERLVECYDVSDDLIKHICENCEKPFFRNARLRTRDCRRYCSRVCSGKMVRKKANWRPVGATIPLCRIESPEF